MDPTEWGAQPVESSPESWGAVPIQEDQSQQSQIPQAFIDRMRAGFALQNAVKKTVGASFEDRFNDVYGDPFEAAAKRTRQAVMPAGGRQEGPISTVIRNPWVVPYAAVKAALIDPIVLHHDLSEQMQKGEVDYGDPATYEKALGAASLGLFVGSGTHFSRVTAEGVQRIGDLPRPEDFQDGAHILGSKAAEENLRTLWNERGIHPAEAVHDADSDAFLREDLKRPGGPDEIPAAAGADVTRPESLPDLEEQPPPRAGTLAERASTALDQLFGLGRNIQFVLDPMATGSNRAMVVAKDAANAVRRVDWEWMRLDQEIQNSAALKAARDRLGETAAQQQERMWNAGDEESVALQLGEKQPKIPPVPLGFTRFFHGGPPEGGEPPTTGGGRWTSTDYAYARDYRSSNGRPGQVWYVDIPKGDPTEVAARMWDQIDEQYGTNTVGRYSSIEVPERWAMRMRPYKETGAAEHMGWATLEPEERRFIEYIDGLGQQAWLRAVDAGLVEGEGLPAYMPRMLLNVATAEGKSPRALNELGRNVFTRTAQMLRREYMMAEKTEAAMRERFGEEAGIARTVRALPLAIAKMEKAAIWKGMIDQIEAIGKATGEDTVADFKSGEGWFTIAGHPAFTKWKPDLEQNPITGKWAARTDDAGNVIFRPNPIWISPEFEGPMRAILESPTNQFYRGLMTMKGKVMTTILNSPLIHNEVVWGKVMEAAGGREWLGFNLYFRGNRIVNNPGRSSELIERGLNPIGPRGAGQDITSVMEHPNLQAGRSWTAQVLAAVPDLFDPAAGDAVRRSIDRAGDFWHNTLLWDRVRDVQFGLADHLSDKLVNQGVDRIAADRVAAHFSNIIVGSIPKEAMSAGAQATANIFLFSRSFTLGNLSTFKQAFTGLPKPIKAQLERDFGLVEGPEGEPVVNPAAEAAFNSAKGMAQRKAVSTIVLSAGLFYVGNALFQHAFNIASGDSSLSNEMNGYAERYRDAMKAVGENPWNLWNLVGRLSPTWSNEPTKSDRVHIGYDQDGTAIYGRLPFGKFGEEMIGYPTMPLEMLKRKFSPPVRAFWEAVDNDKGFGRKIYDDTDKTPLGLAQAGFAVAKHMVMQQLPEGQITAAGDLLRGEGDKLVNEMRVFGPMAGFTASVGAEGGMAKGEQLAIKQALETKMSLAWPDIKKQIKNGDIVGATQKMMDLRVPVQEQRWRIRAALMPGNISNRALQNLFQSGSSEQVERFLNAR